MLRLPALLTFMLLQGASLQAQSLQLYQFDHASWTDRDGVPQQITALAQSQDGTLWLGSENGLYRFDGLTFQAFDPGGTEPSFFTRAISGLVVTEQNALWVVFADKGLARFQGGQASFFDERNGLPREHIIQALEGPKHTMLALAGDRVWQLTGTHWNDITDSIGLPSGTASKALLDHAGRLWIATADHLWVRPAGGGKVLAASARVGLRAALSEARDGTVWVQSIGRTSLTVTPAVSPISPAPTRQSLDLFLRPSGETARSFDELHPIDFGGSQLLCDRSGTFWSGTDHGLWKLDPAPVGGGRNAVAETAGPWNGLSGDSVAAVLEDVSGDIWVATQNGLDRYKRPALTPLLDRGEGKHFSIASTPTGQVWFAAADSLRALSFLHDGVVTAVGPKRIAFTLFCDRDGVLWFSDEKGFWSYASGAFRRYSSPEGVPPREIRQVGGSHFSDLIVLTRNDGLWHFNSGSWTRVSNGSLGGVPTVLTSNARGQIWVGSSLGSINRREPDGRWIECLRPSPELGSVTSLLDSKDGLLAASSRGLGLVQDHHFRLFSSQADVRLNNIIGILRSPNGDLWLNSSHGVMRISAQEADAAIHSRTHALQVEVIPSKDLSGPLLTEPGAPTVVVDSRGLLWFSTFHGIVSIDPSNLHRDDNSPTLLPPVVSVDDRPVGLDRSFSPALHTLRIHYIGVHLSDPQQVSYRYKLDGVDPLWQEVGTTREAMYTGLHHGHYRFELMASNGQGSWSAASDYLEFDIRPTFYQTAWFSWMAGISTILVGWAGLRTRDRYVSGQMTIRAEERAEERVRIARDLHDTLLQGVQGLMLRFHVASLSIPQRSSAREMLDRTLVSADALIIEGRNRISRLRSDSLAGISLNDALQTLCDQLNSNGEVRTLVIQDGCEIGIRPLVKEELYSIAREALANSFSHAGATHIEVTLAYEARRLLLTCKDDGRGFVMPEGAIPPKANHWGLVGMRERASKIGAQLVVESKPGEGTSIVVSISGHRAYFKRPMLQRWRSQP